jgi:hypothetical protein
MPRRARLTAASGSLWKPGPRRPSTLAGIVIRPPTRKEVIALRGAADKAERESVFQDRVSEAAMSLRLDRCV